MCPGTDAYMPPEAIKDNPTYTKIGLLLLWGDCDSNSNQEIP